MKCIDQMPSPNAVPPAHAHSGVRRAVGAPISSFFRYPYLRDSQATLAYLGSRNVAMFSTDVDSFDFKRQTAEKLVENIMKKLEKNGKGIILMHDIQPHTAKALPALLAALKTGGYKVVNMKSKDDVKTLAVPALRHRVVLSPAAQIDGREIEQIVADLVDRTEAPR